jgi:hypothetical protein
VSIVGSTSPAPECDNCGSRYGHNSIRIDTRELGNTPSHILDEGMIYGTAARTYVYVCDVCLFAALRVAFGHLLKKGAR